MANSVYQYEQPRCPDGWSESERRFYNRLIQVLDDIYAKYGRIDEKMLSNKVINRIDNSTETTLKQIAENVSSAEKIAADTVEAAYAYVMSLTAKYGNFDFATIKNLISDALVVEQGQGDYVHITNLAATYAQMVNATIGNLCIQSSDGEYYELDIAPDGTVTANKVEVSEGEILAGETSGSKKPIVSTNISAETLDAETIAASLGLFNKITANMIDVDALVARTAFINSLTSSEAFIHEMTVSGSAFISSLVTSKIFGGESLEIIAEKAESASRIFRQEDFVVHGESVKPGDMLVIPSTGQQYQAEKAGNIQFAMDDEGNLYYLYDGEGKLEMQGFDLYGDGMMISLDGSGNVVGVPYIWELVRDAEVANRANDALSIANAAVSQIDFKRIIRFNEADGLRIGDNKTDFEVLIDSASVNILSKNERVATFTDKYIRFGNMQVQKVRGGLAISVYKGGNAK